MVIDVINIIGVFKFFIKLCEISRFIEVIDVVLFNVVK